jgi:hypothetical protein
MNKIYQCTFEDRIHKHKLPKGFSYVLQTTDITEFLDKDGLALSYSYQADNPQKLEKSVDFSFTKVELLSYHKRKERWGEPGAWDDYNRHLSIYSVPAKIRGSLRAALKTYVLPEIRNLERLPKFKLSVYYRTFHPNNYEPLDWGGLYIESDRYNDDAKVLYRNKEFDLDTEVKELVI